MCHSIATEPKLFILSERAFPAAPNSGVNGVNVQPSLLAGDHSHRFGRDTLFLYSVFDERMHGQVERNSGDRTCHPE